MKRGWPMQYRTLLLTNDLYQSKVKKIYKEISWRKYLAFCHIMWSVYVTTLRFMQKGNRGAQTTWIQKIICYLIFNGYTKITEKSRDNAIKADNKTANITRKFIKLNNRILSSKSQLIPTKTVFT